VHVIVSVSGLLVSGVLVFVVWIYSAAQIGIELSRAIFGSSDGKTDVCLAGVSLPFDHAALTSRTLVTT
jgi:hypothetical protein